MAGMMDDAKDKMSDMGEGSRDRYEDLKAKEQTGDLDDRGREELQQLRGNFENRDDQ